MKTIKDLLELKCRANFYKVIIWDKDNNIMETKNNLCHGDLVADYLEYELLSFDVVPELAETPTYFMGEEMRLMVRPVIVLNVRKGE